MIRALLALRRVGRRMRRRDPRNRRATRAAWWTFALGCGAILIDRPGGLVAVGLAVACGAITVGCDLFVGWLRLRGVREARGS